MRSFCLAFIAFLTLSGFTCCKNNSSKSCAAANTRQLVDTVGFARFPWQMDSLMARIARSGWSKPEGTQWKTVICPHDDYTYVGDIYPELLCNVTAKTLILIGVAHKAASLGISDSLVFDSYQFWKGPWNKVQVSPVREEIFDRLKGKYAIIKDTLHSVEHSVEALIPWLQYFNKDIQIVPVLVPAMTPERMEECGRALADAIRNVADSHKWEWGRDFAVVGTTDAVHYGNEGWGGSDYAYFGCDSLGNSKAIKHEKEIIDNCLAGPVTPEKIKLFSSYTLNPENYKEYKWTWCGRYSVPVTLFTSWFLNGKPDIDGYRVAYSTSIMNRRIPVDDLRMGRTAVATSCHWVGYAAIGYR